jgi:hypothetical protein
MAHISHARTLPADLSAPPVVDTWRSRALLAGVLFAVAAAVLALLDHDPNTRPLDHVLRAWVLGLMLTFGWSVGGLALLMVQYCSGGKWGLLLRRPLEAMTRSLPVVFLYWIVVALTQGRLYMWANHALVDNDLKLGLIDADQVEFIDHCINFKRGMLNPAMFWVAGLACFAIWGFYTWRLNSMALQRDAEGSPRTGPGPGGGNTPYWIKKFENLSGPGIVVYSLTMTAAAIYWVMSLDVTWFSSIYGLLFLVGQGFSVLALSIIVAISLARFEPFSTILRQTEQHDLGKLTFAFVMLNIYLAFGQFLIIWSGNLPDEINWYLDRIRGHWGVIITLDFLFHWVIPFSLLLSRDIKRNKKRLVRVCQFMLFAKAFDLFWLIEPNFKDAARHLHFSFGILQYIAVPAAMASFWLAWFCTQLKARPLVQTNDPHLTEILEPEHATA